MTDQSGAQSHVASELTLFMEKGFQLAVGYLGGLAAIALSASSEFVEAVAEGLGVKPRVLLGLTLALGDVVYLTLASACVFAILKRGLFLLETDISSGGTLRARWEKFLRKNPGSRTLWRKLPVFWNGDTAFFVPLYLLVLLLSGAGVATAWAAAPAPIWRAAAAAIALLHGFPVWILASSTVLVERLQVAVQGAETSSQ